MAARYQIRTMRRDELNFAMDLAAREGWNPGLHDAASFYAADPGGFLISLLDDVPIGCISAVRYGDGFGFLGFYIVVPEHRGRGYGAIRRCREGWKIGPLFADHRGIAEPLLLALCHGIADDEPVYLDVPEVNTEAVRLAADLGMHEVFGTARMYRRDPPEIATDRIFGVTSFELG
ncbi:GNAT family N-acetyltransferase [Castellaniella hirudinis]|uniref:GNAT family N-acetyltransferase n=1 Tax=Castellaniella hirudinis TaxID=1144617 RepID=A0ABV8RVQ6_9BURK